MREALARSDLDFTVREPDEVGRRFADAARLPKILRMACISTAVVVGGVIVVNALFLQDRRHPAPLLHVPAAQPTFAPDAPAPPPTAKAVVAPAIAPSAPAATVAPKSTRDPIADELARASAAPERKAKPPVPVAPKAEAEHADPIGSLIGGTAAPTAMPSASVLAAQKALLRLGYVVRPNGVMSATTKQALEHYERDNHLTPHGELTPRLARDLAAKSSAAAQ